MKKDPSNLSDEKKFVDAIRNHDHDKFDQFHPNTSLLGQSFWRNIEQKGAAAKKDVLQWMTHAMVHNNVHAYESLCTWVPEHIRPTDEDKKEQALKTKASTCYNIFCKHGWLKPPLAWDDQLRLFATWTKAWDKQRFDGYSDYLQEKNTLPEPKEKSHWMELQKILPDVLSFFTQHQHTPLQIMELMTLGRRLMNPIPDANKLMTQEEWMHCKTYCASENVPKTFSVIYRQQLSSEIWNNILQCHPLGDAILHLMARCHVITNSYRWSPPICNETVQEQVNTLRRQYPHTPTQKPLLHRWKKWFCQEFNKTSAHDNLYDRYNPKRDNFFHPSWSLPNSVVSDAYKQLLAQEQVRGTVLEKNWSHTTPREYFCLMGDVVQVSQRSLEILHVDDLAELHSDIVN